MTRSARAEIGSIVEAAAARKYNLKIEGKHESWRDAVDLQGRSVEVKAAVKERSSGYPGYVQIHEQKHERLMSESAASYVIGVYDSDNERVVELRRYPAHIIDLIIKEETGHINVRWDTIFESSSQYL